MNISILISGHTRTISHNMKKNKHLFDKYNTDYYIHFTSSSDSYIHNLNTNEDIIDYLKPVYVVNELENSTHKNNYHNNMKNMWYKFKSLNEARIRYEIHNKSKHFRNIGRKSIR